MTQLIIEDIELPESRWDGYSAYEEVLSVKVEMISTRITEEIRGKVWKISRSFDYLTNSMYRRLMKLLRSGAVLNVVFLPDDEVVLKTGRFVVEKISPPSYAFSRDGVPLWHNFSFTLREERGHD